MRFLKIVLFIVLTSSAWTTQAACSQFAAKDLSVERFTDVGGGQVRWEQGILYLKQGFIASTNGVYDMTIFSLTPALVAPINGQTIIGLALWTGLEGTPLPGGNYLCNYSRSAATYSVNDVANVIVSAKAATVKTPKISISAVDPQASETAGDPGQFLVALNAPTTKNIRVKLDISGKATNGKDYQRIARALLIPAGNVSGIIEILPVDDVKREGTEKVTIRLAREGIRGYTVKRAVASVSIFDND
jgi:hypothetical protein